MYFDYFPKVVSPQKSLAPKIANPQRVLHVRIAKKSSSPQICDFAKIPYSRHRFAAEKYKG
jgi:hypothetical protein